MTFQEMTSDEIVLEFRIMWHGDSNTRNKLGKLIRDYFGLDRGSKLIDNLQVTINPDLIEERKS